MMGSQEGLFEIDIFFSEKNSHRGSPEKPEKRGLLDLARKGKEHWNAWKKKYGHVPVDFSDLDEQWFKDIDFNGFEFPAITSFAGSTLTAGTHFIGVKFDGEVSFKRTTFKGGARFVDTIFTGEVNFSNSKFLKDVIFQGAHIQKRNGDVEFRGCHFKKELTFNPETADGRIIFDKSDVTGNAATFSGNVTFGDDNFHIFTNGADFKGVIFEEAARFSSQSFGETKFSHTIFNGDADFSNNQFTKIEFISTEFHQSSSFKDTKFDGDSGFVNVIFFDTPNFSKTNLTSIQELTFHRVKFINCWFLRGAIFRDRKFLATALFSAAPKGEGRNPESILELVRKRHTSQQGALDKNTDNSYQQLNRLLFRKRCNGKTVFLGVPDFHGCKFHQDTSFVGTEFEVAPSNDAARAFRTLKLAMEGLKSSHEEQMFFRLEMRADRPGLPRGRQWISWLYLVSSNYGDNLWRPFLTLIAFMLLLGSAHGLLTNLYYVTDIAPNFFSFDSDRTWRWFRYIMINTFPVPGFDKTQMELRVELFGKDGYITALATTLEMLHKVISLGCVFLLGLGIRNLFKMKS